MAETLMEPVAVDEEFLVEPPNIDHLITEDDTPVDNIFSEKQQRLLVDQLYASWEPERSFVAAANVGVFYSIHEPPIVPDMLLSLDVQVAEDLWQKGHRAYFLWEFGKPPEVVVEIVSNTRGGETDKKFRIYANMGVWYYVIFDPQQFVQNTALRIYELSLGQYIPKLDQQLTRVELGIKPWEGEFEKKHEQWLRWYDRDGIIIPTGAERAEQETQRAEQETQRAEQEAQRAEQEAQRAEQEAQRAEQEAQRAARLAAQLRALGIEPEA